RIEQAVEAGWLDGLPGAGQPLVFEEDAFVSPMQRMVNRILKNAGFAPEEVSLRQSIETIRRELEKTPAGAKRKKLREDLAWAVLKLAHAGTERQSAQ
ncbi:MAG: DUF1992 domain-containing protein, partial [Zoogloeaceae bacterium]|nr:DUF1992 domain-containing protein [Zoogloeaceae bacterium]